MTGDFASSSVTDEQLVQRMACDDQQALVVLVQRHGTKLAVFARRTLASLGAPEDIEEIVSDAFLRAWNEASSYDPSRAAVGTWLTWLLVAQCLAKRRSLLRIQRLRLALAHEARTLGSGEANQDIDDKIDARTQLMGAFDRLRVVSPNDADLIRRRFFLQQTPAEIAQDLGVSPSYARVKLFRALEKLRMRLLEVE